MVMIVLYICFKFTILWGHMEEILLLNRFFFRLSIHALVVKI